jgi:hypothetical protein
MAGTILYAYYMLAVGSPPHPPPRFKSMCGKGDLEKGFQAVFQGLAITPV